MKKREIFFILLNKNVTIIEKDADVESISFLYKQHFVTI